tara:strand:- start:92 stop:349 length:258 start_codon:yes stop_codon:yes gene_type:complete
LIFSVIQGITLLLILIAYFSFMTVAKAGVTNDEFKVSYYTNAQRQTIQGIKTPNGYRFNSDSNNVVNLAIVNWPPYISEYAYNKG